ncbi:YdcF family protein [Carnobacterium gallinarum]|uniref:YdcF family protein n=1 Tax=Carnobacterium gallinarum TaxID=2749 RepID=UPI0005513BB6|nr:YdcF family protein [Carnobacterium gallinarum]
MFFYWLNLAIVVIFVSSYWHDRRKIINGFLFNLVLFSSCISIAYLAFDSQNPILMTLTAFLLLAFIFILLFGLFILMIAAFFNARLMIQREGKRFANLLTLFAGIAILFTLIFSFTNINSQLPAILQILVHFIDLVIIYFAFIFVNFLTASLIYLFYRPKLNKDYIIVLGSGLIDGYKVPKLLANRINHAIAFYEKQKAKQEPPKIIFSGGRGDDEHLAESVAMQKYAVEEKGIPFEDTLVEDRSVNTLQNMQFSKEIMDKLSPTGYRAIFSTNNFHLFRAGIYAKKAGLSAQGIGAKTAFYYWPNAMIREFIASIVMHKKFHILVVSLIAVTLIVAKILNTYWLPQFQ